MLAHFRAEEPSNHVVPVALVVVSTATLLSLVWAANIVLASPSISHPPAMTTSLAALAKWVDESGSRTVIRAPVAQALGFPEADLPVRERGFKAKNEQLTHVCAVPTEPAESDVVLVALVNESNGDATVWRANRNGELIASALFENGMARRVSNQTSEGTFNSEKAYLLGQMRDRLFRASPQPTAAPKANKSTMERGNITQASIPELPRKRSWSELDMLFMSPWVLPAIAVILMLGVHRGDRRR